MHNCRKFACPVDRVNNVIIQCFYMVWRKWQFWPLYPDVRAKSDMHRRKHTRNCATRKGSLLEDWIHVLYVRHMLKAWVHGCYKYFLHLFQCNRIFGWTAGKNTFTHGVWDSPVIWMKITNLSTNSVSIVIRNLSQGGHSLMRLDIAQSLQRNKVSHLRKAMSQVAIPSQTVSKYT